MTVPCLFLISCVTSVFSTNLSSESVKFLLRTLCFRKRTLFKTTAITSGSSPCFHPRRWLIAIWNTYCSIVKPLTERKQVNGDGSRIIIVSTILQRNLFKMTSGKGPKSRLSHTTEMRATTSPGQMSSRQPRIALSALSHLVSTTCTRQKSQERTLGMHFLELHPR